MVQIELKKSENLQNWMVIELQGELKSRYETGLAYNLIGDLHFTRKAFPVLIVGHHVIYGKKVDLEKPIAVLKKSSEQCDGIKPLLVHAIIKTKLVFSSRPKPIILHVSQKV
ncbi:unnamed protein product [Clavelina lepadiformis]|uniref:Chromosome transmission fidelity protein 8 n=1 Tax=Clavelina lepadiformis TaxID=159417 RepID=A0ABP0GE10_CLALP